MSSCGPTLCRIMSYPNRPRPEEKDPELRPTLDPPRQLSIYFIQAGLDKARGALVHCHAGITPSLPSLQQSCTESLNTSRRNYRGCILDIQQEHRHGNRPRDYQECPNPHRAMTRPAAFSHLKGSCANWRFFPPSAFQSDKYFTWKGHSGGSCGHLHNFETTTGRFIQHRQTVMVLLRQKEACSQNSL